MEEVHGFVVIQAHEVNVTCPYFSALGCLWKRLFPLSANALRDPDTLRESGFPYGKVERLCRH